MNRPSRAGVSQLETPSRAFSTKRVVASALLLVTLVFVWYEYPTKQGPACMPNCEGLDMQGSDLNGMSMRGGNFTQANLQGADLQGASFFLAS